MTKDYHALKLREYAAAQAVALQTEMDASKERLVTVEEALDLILSGVTE